MTLPSDNAKAPWPYHLATFAILAGIVLTIISALNICTTACTDAHNYRLWKMPFEVMGGFFFIALAISHYLSRDNEKMRFVTEILIAGGLGAELFFIFLQKFYIGSWCPICLSIAGCVFLTGIGYLMWEIKEKEENFMLGRIQVRTLVLVLILGFTSSFFGVSKIDQLQAVEDQIKEKIKLGNKNSHIEVYVFTDWACPACRKTEPALIAMGPKVMEEAQVIFVDTVVHPATLNFAPYNISFMVNNKPNYLKIREALTKLALTNSKPTDEDIQKAIKPLGIKLQELPYADVTQGMKYFEELVERFKITATPTVAIVNRDTKKGKKLSGAEDITQENVLKAIKTLQQ